MKGGYTFLRIALSIFSLVLFSCSEVKNIYVEQSYIELDGAASVKGITENRDMDLYDQAGNFYSKNRPPSIHNGEKEVRDFIWKHWSEKKRGYVKITHLGVDALNTFHYFIEPNEQGEWRILQKHVYNHSVMINEKNPLLSEFNLKAERLPSKENSNDWVLILKNKDDQIIDSLPNENIP